MLYPFFWVIPRRLNFMCRRFGKELMGCSRRRHIKFRRQEITQKLEYKPCLIFWMFNSRPISILATNEASLLYLMVLVFPCNIKNTVNVGRQLKRHYRFQILLALLYLLNSIHEHSLKGTAVNRPVNADHSEEKMCQTNGCLSALHFMFN